MISLELQYIFPVLIIITECYQIDYIIGDDLEKDGDPEA